MKKRTSYNIFKLVLCLTQHWGNLTEEDKPRHFGYTKLLSSGKPPIGFDTFLVEKVASAVLCRRTPIHSVSERNIKERDSEKWPWSGTTGTESPACPQQHLLIRCNTLTSWKDGLNSCKVRVIMACWCGWKFNSVWKFVHSSNSFLNLHWLRLTKPI